jgi:hypothetical protein
MSECPVGFALNTTCVDALEQKKKKTWLAVDGMETLMSDAPAGGRQ